MISTRYIIPVIVLLALALIPTIIHSYIGATSLDGKSVNKIPTTLNNYNSVPSGRNSKWGKDIFNSEDWFERDYLNPQQNKVRLFAARSYDHKRLYHHPELALSYGQSLTTVGIINIENSSDNPIHVLKSTDNKVLVAYALVYDDELIKNPILHQFGDSLRLLISARKPMTLLYASQTGLYADTALHESSAVSLLSFAIENFKSQAEPIESKS